MKIILPLILVSLFLITDSALAKSQKCKGNSDRDHDGIRDCLELLAITKTGDIDGDGVTNSEEARDGTKIADDDSDDDGLDDGDDSHPKDADSDDNGIKDGNDDDDDDSVANEDEDDGDDVAQCESEHESEDQDDEDEDEGAGGE